MNYSDIKHKKAPLPFSGQKKNMLRYFVTALNGCDRNTPVYDIFGGSGLLANACLEMGFTDVTYNDYDGYLNRIKRINNTNNILEEIRPILKNYRQKQKVSDKDHRDIIGVIKSFDMVEPVDCISLSSRLLFSMNYEDSIEGLERSTFYVLSNTMTPYDATGYLTGVKTVCSDYRPLIREAKERRAIILLDPPYLSTDISHYGKKEYWNFTEYLDLLYAIEGYKFVYFTSDKSQVIDLLQWYDNMGIASPFNGAEIFTSKGRPSRTAKYTDIMYCNL